MKRISGAPGRPPDVLARPEWRIEGREKVTGGALFAADVSVRGMLHAAFVRSPHAHARIVTVDASAARAMPGVHAVLIGADVRPAQLGRRFQDWPALCWDTVRFVGDRVAVVAAESPEQAEAAARAVEVTYAELPAVFDPEEALRPDAPVLHPEVDSYRLLGGRRPELEHPNLQDHVVHEHGNVAEGFRAAARVFEHRFAVPRVHQGYLEPRACVVWVERQNADGAEPGERVHVLTTNKGPFQLREQMSTSLGIPPESIEVETVHIGGDFGGKGLSLDEWPLYFLARATGRPVRAVMSYTDELTASSTRHSARITLRTAVDANGRITAHEARIAYDGGAYAAGNPGPRLVPVETMGSLPGYRVPAARVEAIDVYTNTLPAGNARCPGGPQVLFAAESHMDLIARDLGLDPIDFRLRNLAEVGDLDVHGERWIGSEMRTILTKLREVVRWDAPRGPNRGRGVAMALRHVGFGRTSLTLTLLPDGSIDVRTGVTDQGSGGFTVIQRVIAQELGLEPDCVRVQQATTASAPEDPGVGGSRVTAVHGNAALDGARKLRAILDQRAPGQTIAEAAMRLGPLEVVGVGEQDQHVYGGCAYGLEVAVNPDTGECRVTSAALVADVGTVINPVALRGQLEGGFVYGLGQALTEELRVEDGRVVNPLLADYKLPTIADAPSLDIVLHTEAPGCGPFGAKSVGELTNAPVPAAVANAIHDAAGVRLFSLPLSAEKVLAALEERASVDASALSEARRTAA